jgi:uncharacterized membrane protein YdjX (TVP38/TMEM64 family)
MRNQAPDQEKMDGTKASLPAPGLAVARILALFAVIAITIFVYSIRDQAQALAIYGYPGIFLIALLTNATVFLPAPGIAVVFALGAVFNPALVGIAAGAGGALGELSGYLAGFSGQAVVQRTSLYQKLVPWVAKYGFWTILFLSAIPNPTFDVAGVAAGVLKMPMARFLLAVWIGVTLKMVLFAFAGAYSITWVLGK